MVGDSVEISSSKIIAAYTFLRWKHGFENVFAGLFARRVTGLGALKGGKAVPRGKAPPPKDRADTKLKSALEAGKAPARGLGYTINTTRKATGGLIPSHQTSFDPHINAGHSL